MKTETLKFKLNNWIENLKTRNTNKKASENTKKTYYNAVMQFISFAEAQGIDDITADTAKAYRDNLLDLEQQGEIKPSTINSRLTGLNKFFIENELSELKLKLIEPPARSPLDDTLEESDYKRLMRWCDILTNPAQYNKNKSDDKKIKPINCTRDKLIMQTLVGTGIRISELQFFTVENVKAATRNNPKILVDNKGKKRFVIIPAAVRKELLKYAKDNNIKKGYIFRSKPIKDRKTGELKRDSNGDLVYKPLDQAWIWRRLKMIAGKARVKKSRVHAHSFRHLFAKRYMDTYKNLSELADLLGHESLETTRIYANESSKSKQNKLDNMLNAKQ